MTENALNARPIQGWALDRMIEMGSGTPRWNFFENRAAAEQEALRLGVGVVSAKLVLPANPTPEGEGK